ncbi:MAG: hypothetical protein GXY83_22005 [Rhodopirellula sp.]|nr:hypothetical protein [Rhodopirellula sp.]
MKKLAVMALLAVAWPVPVCRAETAGQCLDDLRCPVASVRQQAAQRLGRIGDPAATPELIRAMEDPEKTVRREAAKALGSIKDDRAVPALCKALADSDANVRFYAAYALGEIKDPRAAKSLVEAFRDPQWMVRDQAAWAIREIGDPQTLKPLVAMLAEQRADMSHLEWLLGRFDAEKTAASLAPLLSHPEPAVRLRAAVVLGRIQDKAVFHPLLAALKNGDPAVRRTAIEALVVLRDDRAVAPLGDLAARETDAIVRAAAAKAAHDLSRHEALAAHWSFDAADGRIAIDVSGGGSDGEIIGCMPVEGKIGHALKFGEGAYIELGKPQHLPIADTPLTVAAWIKSDAPNGVVVARGGAYCGFSLYLKDGLPKFGIRCAQDSPAAIAAGREPVGGQWTHLAGVIQSDRVEVYVNGKLAGSETSPGYIPGNCGQGMEIGYDVASSPAEIIDHFQGIIDEVKVFHAALSAAELARQINAPPASSSAPTKANEPK